MRSGRSESAGNSFTLGPYVETSGLTDDELIILGSFLAHNPVPTLLQARAALEPFARLAERYDGWDGRGSTVVVIDDIRAARAAWLALGGEEK